MSRGRQKIEFTGLFQANVLGTFSIIRGFADLRDLAEVSVPIPYKGTGLGNGEGYQRSLDDAHVEALKRFLSKGRYRFFPEVVLSLRSQGKDDPVASFWKRRAASSDATYAVRVNLKTLRSAPTAPIRRIDGNHRLEAAVQLAKEQRSSASFKDFTKAPFCLVVLHSDRPEDDDLAEAMLFNLINSKALAIVSEHSLSVLMQDNGSPAERFDEDPQLYLTRSIRDRVRTWPKGFFEALGDSPLTSLHATAKVLQCSGGFSSTTLSTFEAEIATLFDPLYDLAIRLQDHHAFFVKSPIFLPIAAEVYRYSSGTGTGGATSNTLHAERRLREFARWFERLGGADFPILPDPTVLWAIFKRDYERRAGAVFLALSFRENQTLKSVGKAMKEAVALFNKEHADAPLTPVRVDEQRGASYEIPARVFQDIDRSKLLIADLTDERPNVYCEVGYAKSRGIPFILTFHKKDGTRGAPWDRKFGGNRVHFDLAAFRHIAYDNALDLRDELKVELDAWFLEGHAP